MSLLNQMLQDLDSRRATVGPKSGLPNEVRPLPAARRSNAPLIVGVGVALSALVLWFAWQLADAPAPPGRQDEAPVTVPPSLPTPPPLAVVVPGLPPSPLVPVPAGVVEAAVVPPAAPVVPAEDDEARLRLTTSLRLLPEREPSPERRAAPVVPPKAAMPPAAAAPVASPPAKPSGAMLIEKTVSSGSPHERAEAEYRKAVAVLNAGRLNEAIDGLRSALKQDGAHSPARQLLFKLLIENKRLDDAAELLREGLQLQPAQLSWAMSLGRLQVDRGDLPGAWQTLQRSLPFAAGSADYQGFAAHVLQRLGRSKEAVEHYQNATRLAPAEGRWWLGLGLVLEADGHAAEARDALLRARASGTLSAELISLVDQKLR
jgi:MSHA biogenesis protein MshN